MEEVARAIVRSAWAKLSPILTACRTSFHIISAFFLSGIHACKHKLDGRFQISIHGCFKQVSMAAGYTSWQQGSDKAGSWKPLHSILNYYNRNNNELLVLNHSNIRLDRNSGLHLVMRPKLHIKQMGSPLHHFMELACVWQRRANFCSDCIQVIKCSSTFEYLTRESWHSRRCYYYYYFYIYFALKSFGRVSVSKSSSGSSPRQGSHQILDLCSRCCHWLHGCVDGSYTWRWFHNKVHARVRGNSRA